MKENKVPQMGVSGESFSLSLLLEKEGRKRPLLPFILLLLPQFALPAGKHPFLHFSS